MDPGSKHGTCRDPFGGLVSTDELLTRSRRCRSAVPHGFQHPSRCVFVTARRDLGRSVIRRISASRHPQRCRTPCAAFRASAGARYPELRTPRFQHSGVGLMRAACTHRSGSNLSMGTASPGLRRRWDPHFAGVGVSPGASAFARATRSLCLEFAATIFVSGWGRRMRSHWEKRWAKRSRPRRYP